MKKYTLVLIVALVQAIGVTSALAAEPIGKAEHVEGLVTVESGAGAVNTLMVASPIYLNDRIVTGPSAKVQIRFDDNSLLSQGENGDMTINEYVYSPGIKKDNSCSLRLIKGVFRVITDKITKLNPDRFKVTTNYGTIGIRGCDLGFTAGDAQEEVYVVELHHADSVLVALSEEAAKGAGLGTDVLEISEQGFVVELSPLTGLKKRRFNANELRDLVVGTTPVVLGTVEWETVRHPLESAAVEQAGERSAALEQQVAAGTGGGTPGEASPDGNSSALKSVTTVKDDVSQVVSDFDQNQRRDEARKETTQVLDTLLTPPTDTTPQRTTASSDDNTTGPTYPQVGPKMSLSGSGSGWSWGAWTRDKTDLVAGVPETAAQIGSSVSGSHLAPADVAAIAAGGMVFVKGTASGSAGAAVAKGTMSSLLAGGMTMNVTLGGGLTPTWDATVNVANGGDALNFSSSGGITAGVLGGGLDSYSLNAFGSTYGMGSLSSQSVDARLVNSGNPADPISGGTLKFGFGHGPGGPNVAGAGGGDF